MYLPCIDPDVRNTLWKISHDVLYVNYFLFCKNINKNKLCPSCKKIETSSHLFLECKQVSQLNKIVLLLLRKLTNNTITLSELVFKFHILPPLQNRVKEICLILLSESRHVVWLNRNINKHENKNISTYSIVSQFLNKLKFRILVDKERYSLDKLKDYWCKSNIFCSYDENSKTVIFNSNIDVDTYFKRRSVQTT